MKILILRTAANIINGGTYNLQEVGLAKALIRKGHQCDVAYYYGNNEEKIEKVIFDEEKTLNIRWLKGKKVLGEAYYPTLKNIVDEYDIIQIGGYVGLASWWINTKRPSKAVNYQGPYFCPYNKKDNLKAMVFDRVLLPISNKKNMIVMTKSKLASEYMQKKKIKEVYTLGVGLDLDNLICKNTEKSDLITKLDQEKEDNKYILYMGAWEERRNTIKLLEIFSKINIRDNKTKLILVGKGKKEYVDACYNKIKELKIEDKVVCIESIEQKYVHYLYEMADVFLLPTRYEIFGMVILEAMYFGVPIITTYNGGSSTLFNNGGGVIVDKLNVDEWADETISLLKDEERRTQIIKKAKETIEEEFLWDKLAEKFVEVYHKRIDRTL